MDVYALHRAVGLDDDRKQQAAVEPAARGVGIVERTDALDLLAPVFGVLGEAAANGLGPKQILEILPYVVPSLLPFTIPATLLLTTCVVYGRMSGDQEITATKAAGISVMSLLWPSFILAAFLSLGTFILTDQFIPWARTNIQQIITLAMEDIFLDVLRAKQQINQVDHGISIAVIRVDGKRLIHPTFQYESKDGSRVTIQAQEATLKFDLQKKQVLLQLYRGHIATAGQVAVWFDRTSRPFPLPMSEEEERPRNLPIDRIRRQRATTAVSRVDVASCNVEAVMHGEESTLAGLSPPLRGRVGEGGTADTGARGLPLSLTLPRKGGGNPTAGVSLTPA